MYCSECNCEFDGWTWKCPVCRTNLIDEAPIEFQGNGKIVSYDALLTLVKKNSGKLEIDLATTAVERKGTWRFPYKSYGFAWVKRIKGEIQGIFIDLCTREIGTSKKWRFPYNGYGCAWEKSMDGHVGGNDITLSATKVKCENKWRFPYFGFGYGWTETFTGHCGNHLDAELISVEVCKKRGQRFPYRGYGYAWTAKSMLILKFNEGRDKPAGNS